MVLAKPNGFGVVTPLQWDGRSAGAASGRTSILSLIKFAGTNVVQSFQIVRGLAAPVDEVLVGHRLYVLQFDLVTSSIWEITLPRNP